MVESENSTNEHVRAFMDDYLAPVKTQVSDGKRLFDDFNIFIATPHSYEAIYKEWFRMYEELMVPTKSRLYMNPSMPLDVNRNECVEEALSDGCEYIFFVDHDNVLPPDTLITLLQYNLPVVGCLYFERKYPHLPVVYTFSDDYERVQVMYKYPKGLVQADVIGMGCALIHTDVFRKISPPWFSYKYKGHTWGTEDIAFFHRLKDHGVQVVIDTQHTVGHLAHIAVGEEDWLRYRDAYVAELAKQAEEAGTTGVYIDKKHNKTIPQDH